MSVCEDSTNFARCGVDLLDDENLARIHAGETETIGRGAAGPVSPPDAEGHDAQGTEHTLGAPQGPAVAKLSDPPRKRWYAVQHENFNGGYARLSIRALGFRVHWPREIVRAHRHDDVLVPLFRPYLFVEFDRTKPWADIQHAGGVVTILGVKEFGAPIPAPVGEIEALIWRVGGDDDGLIDTTDDRKPLPFRTSDTLEPGEELTFLDHSLFGQKAVVQQDRGRQCLDAMMRMFGMETRARIRRDRVKRST